MGGGSAARELCVCRRRVPSFGLAFGEAFGDAAAEDPADDAAEAGPALPGGDARAGRGWMRNRGATSDEAATGGCGEEACIMAIALGMCCGCGG